MDNQLDGFLSANEPVEEVAPEAAVEAPPEAETPIEAAEPPTETVERPRGPDGKFVAKGVEVASPATEEAQIDHPALIGERRRRQEAEDRYRELEERLKSLEQPQAPAPDMFEDPDGFQNHLNDTVSRAVLNATLNLSEEMTSSAVGVELVEEAKQWGGDAFRANPALYQQFVSQRNPYGFLVQEFKRQKAYSQLGDPAEIDAYLQWKAEKAAAQPAPVPVPTPIPDTLADAQSVRGGSEVYSPPTLEAILHR